jgi:hypothetical protein
VSIDAENGESELSYQSNLMPASAFQPQHLWPATDALLRIPWGTQHIDIDRLTQEGTPLQRAAWTHAEIKYLDNWEKQNCSIFTKNRVRLCLDDMLHDPNAIAIFHPAHTLNTTRLTQGFRKVKESRQLQAEEQTSAGGSSSQSSSHSSSSHSSSPGAFTVMDVFSH